MEAVGRIWTDSGRGRPSQADHPYGAGGDGVGVDEAAGRGPRIHRQGRGHETRMVRGGPQQPGHFPFQIGGEVRGKSTPVASATDESASVLWRDRESQSPQSRSTRPTSGVVV